MATHFLVNVSPHKSGKPRPQRMRELKVSGWLNELFPNEEVVWITARDCTNGDEWVPARGIPKRFTEMRDGRCMTTDSARMEVCWWDLTPREDLYWARVHRARCGGKNIYFGFKNPLLAIYLAYCNFETRNATPSYLQRVNLSDVQSHYKVLKAVYEARIDQEYNDACGLDVPPPPPIHEEAQVSWNPSDCRGSVDEAIYQSFRHLLKDSILRSNPVSGFGGRSSCVGTLETLPGEEVFLSTGKNKIDFDYVGDCVKRNGYSPLVTQFPKSGVVTSDGKTRSIYPMNIGYHWALCNKVGDAHIEHPRINFVKGRSWPLREMDYYDIKSCDKQLLPYVIRFSREEEMPFLLPFVHTPQPDDPFKYGYPIEQFPSGVYHTTLVNHAFAGAVALNSWKEGTIYIQGDGIAVERDQKPLHLPPFVRKTRDINGFIYKDGKMRYSRCNRLLEWKYLRGRGPFGVNRLSVLMAAYSLLDGEFYRVHPECRDHEGIEGEASCRRCRGLLVDSKHLYDLPDKECLVAISRHYSELGRAAKIACEENNIEPPTHDQRKNNWDTAPTITVAEGIETMRSRWMKFPRYEWN